VSRDDRGRLTTLLKRAGVKSLPIGTRRIDVVISVKVDNNGKNQAYVDNVSLTLAAAPAPPPGGATLTVSCSGTTLVASVKPPKGATVTSVVFLANGKLVIRDTKAPFSARRETAGLSRRITVSAQVASAGRTTTLTRSIARC
jgi:hypothetical protein